MTLRDLEIFIAVAETGDMSSAAKKLFISQPAVSHAIKNMENEYHVPLFKRISKRLYITETGLEVLNYARTIIETYQEMERYLQLASRSPHIHIGASLTIGSSFLSDIITQFENKYPDISIRAYIDNSKNIEQKISDGILDIAIIEGNTTNADIVAKNIYEDEMVLICGKNHSFATLESIQLADLRDQGFVVREEGSGTRGFLLDLTKSKNIPIVMKWTCHSSDSIINAVASGQGLSILSKSLVKDVPSVIQIRIRDLSLHRNFKIIHHKDKPLTTDLEKLMLEIEDVF